MANYVFYEGRWRGHSQNDTIPEQAKTFLSRRQDTDTGIIYYYDGFDWLRSGTHDVGSNYIQMSEIAVPTTPAADKCRLFIDSATGLLSQVDSAGVVTPIGGEGGGGGGSGEANTASNTGSTGTGLFKAKTLVDLAFYKIASANNRLSVALSGTDYLNLTINEANFNLANLGGTLADGSLSANVLTTSNTKTLTNKTIDADGTGNSITNIENADIKAAAGIVYSKLSLTGGIVNADINASAAIAKSKLASLDVVNADVNASAAIATSKLAEGSVFAKTNAANTFSAVQKISVDNGSLITFYRPVNNAGFGGGFLYNFNNSSAAEVSYGNEYVSIEDNTATTHRGDFNIQLAIASALGIRFRVFTSGNGGIIAGNNQRILISETGLASQRTFTLPDSDQTLVGRTDTATFTNKTLTAPVIGTYIDFTRVSAPSDPGTNVGRLYHKQKDANNDGIFAKLKTGGAITEVELGVADDVLTLNELADAIIASPAVNQTLVYQTGSATFENKKLKTRMWLTTTFSTTSNGVRFQAWGSGAGSLTTEANIKTPIYSAMTLKRVTTRVQSNGKDGSTSFSVRKNEADITGTTSSAAAAVTTSAAFDSSELSVAFASGDFIAVKVDLSASSNAGSMTVIITTEYEVEAFA